MLGFPCTRTMAGARAMLTPEFLWYQDFSGVTSIAYRPCFTRVMQRCAPVIVYGIRVCSMINVTRARSWETSESLNLATTKRRPPDK